MAMLKAVHASPKPIPDDMHALEQIEVVWIHYYGCLRALESGILNPLHSEAHVAVWGNAFDWRDTYNPTRMI
jgi:hypothetical protein